MGDVCGVRGDARATRGRIDPRAGPAAPHITAAPQVPHSITSAAHQAGLPACSPFGGRGALIAAPHITSLYSRAGPAAAGPGRRGKVGAAARCRIGGEGAVCVCGRCVRACAASVRPAPPIPRPARRRAPRTGSGPGRG